MMRCTNLGPVAGRRPGGPTDPKLVIYDSLCTKLDFLKFFFVKFV